MASVNYPLTRERNLLLGVLLALAVAAWVVLLRQAAGMEDDEMGLTMGMSALLFLGIWIAMMVAMMFPSAVPMILTFAQVQTSRRRQSKAAISTWLFVLGYLIVWVVFGAVAYLIAELGDSLADRSMWLMDNASRLGGGLLILAGAYQLSPLKARCLSTCRTPTTFIMTSWRDGQAGALRMGAEHGAYCLGCCWLLFLVLFPLGMMNIAVLAGLTLLIFAEKSLAIGPTVARLLAVGLVVYGSAVVLIPDALPIMM